MEQNIWFTSDTHYHHKNIVRGVSEWKDFRPKDDAGIQSLRDFDTLSHHDDTLVNTINALVKPDDILYHLGDWSFGGKEQIGNFRERLHVKTIHLVLGNHDQHIEKEGSIYKDLFTSVNHVLQPTVMCGDEKVKLFLSHYSHQVWNKSHKGIIHLFGHSHGSLKGIGRSMDVGVDTNEMRPYLLGDILFKMRKIEVQIVDHHNERTN